MKLPQPRKIIAEKYVAGLSLFKSRRSPIKLSANESALGPSPKAVKSYSSIGKGFVRYPDSDAVENGVGCGPWGYPKGPARKGFARAPNRPLS